MTAEYGTCRLQRGLAVLLIAVCLYVCDRSIDAVLAAEMHSSPLIIETQDGAQHAFKVELAVTDKEQALGLMYRAALPADAGMLFIYPYEQEITMWMKNTRIPLDMIFADASGRIVSITERAVPHSLEIISSRRLAKLVLEVNGGTVDRLGIRVGDLMRHEAMGNSR